MTVKIDAWSDSVTGGLIQDGEEQTVPVMRPPDAMTFHKEAEYFASQAELSIQNNMPEGSVKWFYRNAAWAECYGHSTMCRYDKVRTYSILAVSAGCIILEVR